MYYLTFCFKRSFGQLTFRMLNSLFRRKKCTLAIYYDVSYGVCFSYIAYFIRLAAVIYDLVLDCEKNQFIYDTLSCSKKEFADNCIISIKDGDIYIISIQTGDNRILSTKELIL